MREGAPVTLTAGDLKYEWIDDWGRVPADQSATAAWPHHGIAALPSGELATFHPARPTLLLFEPDGSLRRTVDTEIEDAHGITMVREGDAAYLWIADAAMRQTAASNYEPPATSQGSAVAKLALSGRILTRLPRPELAVYGQGEYRPTCVAVNEARSGGNGDIWVADGYGESYVHRYDASGRYLRSLSGEEGAGRFKSPHAVFIDRRRGEPELYIADRNNARIQVYDLDGRFRRVVGAGVLSRPTWFAVDGDRLLVLEFRPPRLTVLDSGDRLVGYLAENPQAPSREGWPNELDGRGRPRRTTHLTPGKLNSPHSLALDREGNIYITEWLIGGRITKLRKLSG
ncbi:MAG: peptidylglycine monooxygenase-like protein [Candidatus Dormibacteria bacterium]